MKYTTDDIKKLREETGAGIIDCQKALQEADGDYQKALKLVEARGLAKAEKKEDRETSEGYIASYVHTNGKIAALVEIQCETDFVARNPELRTLALDIAMQVTAMNPESTKDLLEQDFIRDGSVTIDHLVKSLSGKIGEKIIVHRFVRFELGEND